MKTKNYYKKTIFILLFQIVGLQLSTAQRCQATTVEQFYACYGGQSAFGTHSVDALTTFIQVEDSINAGRYDDAKFRLNDFFRTYPHGDLAWNNIMQSINGANLGGPHAYYALRMAEEIVDYERSADPNTVAIKANMKIVLVGGVDGIFPETEQQLLNGEGKYAKFMADPKLKADNYRVLKQSMSLFLKYVKAITNGQLEVNVEFVELNNLTLPVTVPKSAPFQTSIDMQPVWNNIASEVKDNTDWWMVLYPSYPAKFNTDKFPNFIAGGIGTDSKGGPVFMADDTWFTSKPRVDLGIGDYTDIERRAYHPMWWQHEFFHHLFLLYPEFKLEATSHSWFTRSAWPEDFVGEFENDYYAESLNKRIKLHQCESLASKLITRKKGSFSNLYSSFSMDELLGAYSLDDIQDPFHEGEIIKEFDKYYWKNKANVQWEVTPDFTIGQLVTGPDNPYLGENFTIKLYKDLETGNFLPGAVSLLFNREEYKKRFNLLEGKAPIEICLGSFERVPNTLVSHSGTITKSAGNFYWTYKNTKKKYALTPNTNSKLFSSGSYANPPLGKNFDLILVNDGCQLNNLGFKSGDYYYWKPKRIQEKLSPKVIKPLKDLQFSTNWITSYKVQIRKVFTDSDSPLLHYYVTSSDPTIVTAKLRNNQIILGFGSKIGKSTVYVMALDNNGGIATDEFIVEVKSSSTGARFENNDSDFGIKLFPNPAVDQFTISGIDTGNYITISASNGKVIKEIQATSESMMIAVNDFAKGLYIVEVLDQNKKRLFSEKIIKN